MKHYEIVIVALLSISMIAFISCDLKNTPNNDSTISYNPISDPDTTSNQSSKNQNIRHVDDLVSTYSQIQELHSTTSVKEKKTDITNQETTLPVISTPSPFTKISKKTLTSETSTTTPNHTSPSTQLVANGSQDPKNTPDSCKSPNVGQWNLERGDQNVTGYQSLPMNIEIPSLEWKLKLNGPKVPWAIHKDLDHDGMPELLVPEADGIGAWQINGEQIWFSPTPDYQYIESLDLDANGTVEVILSRSYDGSILVLEGTTGFQVLKIEQPEGRDIQSYNIHIGNYLPGVPGVQIAVIANGGHGTVVGNKILSSLYSFPRGVLEAELIWHHILDESTEDKVRFVITPISVTGDIDGDGSIELVTLIHDGLVIQNMISGVVEHYLPDLIGLGRNYGTAIIDDFDLDGKNELLVLADLLDKHIELFKISENETNIS